MNTLIERIGSTIKNWWVSLILGILYVGVGILLLVQPLNSYFILSVIFSVALFISGILEIIFAVSNRGILSGWGWYLTGGIVDLILGIVLIGHPLLSMQVIPLIVAFWFMFRGFTSIGFSIDLQRYGTKGWGWFLFLGIIAILASILIIWQPAVGALTVVYMISFTFLVVGIFRILLSFQLRNLYKDNRELYR